MSVTRCGMKTSSPSTTCGIPPGQPGRHPADPGGAGDPPTWTGSQGRAVVHCAAYIDVAQPAREPGMYWRNNVAAPAAFFEKARGKDVVSRRRPPSTGSRSRCRSPTPRRARAQAEDFAQGHEPDPAPTSAQWRRLIAKIWEADALTCPDCGAEMRILAFIEEDRVIGRILRHLGLLPDASRCPPLQEFGFRVQEGRSLLIITSCPGQNISKCASPPDFALKLQNGLKKCADFIADVWRR